MPDIKGPPPDNLKAKRLMAYTEKVIADSLQPTTYLDTVEVFTKCFGQPSNAETIHTDIYPAMEYSGIIRQADSTYNNTVEAAEPNAGEVIASFLESLKGIRSIPEPKVRYYPMDQSFWVEVFVAPAIPKADMDTHLPIIGNEPDGK